MTKVRFRNRAELELAIRAGTFAGKALHLLVLHDDACTPERCSCSPEYEVEDLSVESYQAGQRAQADWIRRSRS